MEAGFFLRVYCIVSRITKVFEGERVLLRIYCMM